MSRALQERQETLTVRRLDDFSFSRRVQLIKIDVEFMELQAPKIYQKMWEYCIFCFLCWPSQLLRYPQAWHLPELSCAEFWGKSSTVTVTVDGRHRAHRDIYCDQVVLGAKSTILQNKPLIWVENEAYFDDPPNRTFVESRPLEAMHSHAKKQPTWSRWVGSVKTCCIMLCLQWPAMTCYSVVVSFNPFVWRSSIARNSFQWCLAGKYMGLEMGRPKHHQTCQLLSTVYFDGLKHHFPHSKWQVLPFKRPDCSEDTMHRDLRYVCTAVARRVRGQLWTVVVWTRSSNLRDISRSFQNQWYISLNYR